MKTALIFPGQGSQYVGMGRDFYDKYQTSREIFLKLNHLLNRDISGLIFSGDKDELSQTQNAQPAIMATSIAILNTLISEDLIPNNSFQAVAGHSLGEYSALSCAGYLDFSDTLKILRIRGDAMQNAVPKGQGGMVAVLGSSVDVIEKILTENKNTSFRLCVSIDGTKEVHNKIRGVEKSYDNAIKTFFALKELKKEYNNIHVDINTTVSKFNYENFFLFTNLVQSELDPDHHTTTLTRGITKEDDADDIPIDVVSKIYKYIKDRDKKHEKLEHKLITKLRHTMYTEIERIFLEKSFKYYCTAGKKFMVIYQDGSASPCEILHTIHPDQSATFGNLKDYDFNCQSLLKAKEAQDRIKWIKNNKCFCTFECAKSNDVAFNPKLTLKTLARLLI